MPYSSNVFDALLQQQVIQLNAQTVLDVGAGAGKNASLIRAVHKCRIDAVEPTSRYIREFELKKLYDVVYECSLQEFAQTQPRSRHDLVLFTDVLEHLFRSEAIDYLDYFLYRSKWVCAIWPCNLPQDDWEGNGFEVHKSNFGLKDLAENFEVEYFAKQYFCCNHDSFEFSTVEMNYCLLKGYLTKKNETIPALPN